MLSIQKPLAPSAHAALFSKPPLSPPKNHLLPQEALSRLIVILQRLGFGESVPLPLLEAVDPHAQPEGEPEGGYYN